MGTNHIKFDAVNGQHVLDGSILPNDIHSHATNNSTRVNLNFENFDPFNWHDASTPERVIPTVAGIYLLVLNVDWEIQAGGGRSARVFVCTDGTATTCNSFAGSSQVPGMPSGSALTFQSQTVTHMMNLGGVGNAVVVELAQHNDAAASLGAAVSFTLTRLSQ